MIFFQRKKHAKSVEVLIEFGAKTTVQGWMYIQNEWIFGSPLELVTQMLNEQESINWKRSLQYIIQLLTQEIEIEKLKTFSTGTKFTSRL